MNWKLAADNSVLAPAEAVQACFDLDVGGDPASGFGYKSRRAGEYNDYTQYHLPKRLVANPAIFAARIARSNRATRF